MANASILWVVPNIRRPAVAGSWYPGKPADLASAVDGYLAAVVPALPAQPAPLAPVAIIAPHAGLVYSGPVAAYAYHTLLGQAIDVAILVGPSHFAGFDGVALYPSGDFETPLGVVRIDEACAADLLTAAPIVHVDIAPHGREHSLEMQLPFLQRVAPGAAIVPLLMGSQTAAAARALGDALAAVVGALHDRLGRRAILVASTDLSHYHNAVDAGSLDAVVIDHVARADADGLQRSLERTPEHACGGGPTVAVMRAARILGASHSKILKYADSGDVSGDKSSVVGYLAAVLRLAQAEPERGNNTTQGGNHVL
jgi:AmmeMemoRadiSam system protein B